MVKRIAVSVIIGAAVFGALMSGVLARHRELRGMAVELVRLDLEILVGR